MTASASSSPGWRPCIPVTTPSQASLPPPGRRRARLVRVPRPKTRKFRFAVVAAGLRGGAEPGLLGAVAWWRADDFWQYALLAAVAYLRVATDRAGVPVRQVCQELPRS